ncbi:hypothetical protein M427DRAFT_153741 [Gonapodya prolifera JEL478]|uniref:PB1 domain-containing protein n=1 Tax=Gonapodya prolifera (strain JEL478) TaxID=1344416 RepID=A0A139ALA9_GONPJ|nr:hypothetical protein M427DRAFT_153741 [Gonapodya prolifera JEL478]|eukprot:KXS17530.1 hypothetical protein M427DRAFT_153741 [Gonapodya prolifera JEL478]
MSASRYQQPTSIVLKATYRGETKRVTLSRVPSELSFDDLILTVQRIFKIAPTDGLAIRYFDDEGTLVLCESDVDVSHALSISHLLKINVTNKRDQESSESVYAIRKGLEKLKDDVEALLRALPEKLEEGRPGSAAGQSGSTGPKPGAPDPPKPKVANQLSKDDYELLTTNASKPRPAPEPPQPKPAVNYNAALQPPSSSMMDISSPMTPRAPTYTPVPTSLAQPPGTSPQLYASAPAGPPPPQNLQQQYYAQSLPPSQQQPPAAQPQSSYPPMPQPPQQYHQQVQQHQQYSYPQQPYGQQYYGPGYQQ